MKDIFALNQYIFANYQPYLNKIGKLKVLLVSLLKVLTKIIKIEV